MCLPQALELTLQGQDGLCCLPLRAGTSTVPESDCTLLTSAFPSSTWHGTMHGHHFQQARVFWARAALCYLQYPLSHMSSGQSLRIPLTDRKGNSAGEISFKLEVQGGCGRSAAAGAGLLLKPSVPWGPALLLF